MKPLACSADRHESSSEHTPTVPSGTPGELLSLPTSAQLFWNPEASIAVDVRSTLKPEIDEIDGASRVNQLVQLAKATFSQSKHEPGFTEHLEKLKKFVSTCTSTKQAA